MKLWGCICVVMIRKHIDLVEEGGCCGQSEPLGQAAEVSR